MRRALWGLLAVAVAGLGAVAPARAQDSKKATIAVANFTYTARAGVAVTVRGQHHAQTIVVPDLGIELETSTLTQKFVTQLVQTGKFDVVERAKLEHALAEQQLGQSGMVDQSRAVQMGKMFGADYFLEGVINVFDVNTTWKEIPYTGGYHRVATLHLNVDLRIVDTRTSKIVAAEKGEVTKVDDRRVQEKRPIGLTAETLDEIQRELVEKLVIKVIDGVYPVKVLNVDAQGTVFINRGEGGGVKVGDTYDVFSLGEELKDPDTGASLGFTESKIAGIRVTDVLPKFSKAQILGGTPTKGAICRRGAGDFSGPVAPPPPPPPPADLTPPVIRILAPRAEQMLNSNPVNVVVEVSDDSGTVSRVTICGSPATQDADNPARWRKQVKASEGANKITVKAWDPSGNEGSAEVIFHFKEKPPEVEGQAIVTYRGRVDDPKSKVTVNGQPVTVNADGTFQCQVKPDANGNITVIATDEFGNATTKVEHVGG